MPKTSTCAGCGKPMIWAVSPTGAKLPLSAKPTNIYMLDDEDPPNARVVATGYLSHFVDCPQRDQFRKS